MLAGPVDVLVLTDLQEQLELLGKQRVVVLQSQPEQWKGLDERTAAHDDLRAALRQKIEGGEALEHAHRVGRAQDRYRTGETYPVRSCRRGSQNDRRGGIEIFLTVVFADSKYVQANLIGMLDLLDQVAQTVRRAHGTAGVVVRRREAIDADLHLRPRLPQWSDLGQRSVRSPSHVSMRWVEHFVGVLPCSEE